MRFLSSFVAASFFAAAVAAQPQQHIAPTEALSPEKELATFKLPAGFEAQLVAAEPDIGKPIQMAFDAKGRLWVATSREYPFPAKEEGRDRIFILEDFDAKGKARKITTFADDLNIPIGILPLPDCKSCLVYSIPNIWLLTDTDGDGKADKREVLYGPFGHKDTHGMVNSFTDRGDGWIYACHGFSNDSKVKGKDGHEVAMNSGNTFRFKLDGSRVESWTRGQVNPFGMTVDPNGFLYNADCHSKPLTQLIPKAVYSSFGKPHDGLGYGPDMIRHDHGSTAICGPAWYNADLYPKQYKGCIFLCNVVTNRVHRDKIEFTGSTPKAVEQEEFMLSKDPWFRPVDVKVGPDGALYVADFYNRIIGHYEVPLDHPGRDRERGRIWRVVPTSTSTPKMQASNTTRKYKLYPVGEWNETEIGDFLVHGKDPFQKRALLERLVEKPVPNLALSIRSLIGVIPASDTHLLHAARVALREHLLQDAAWNAQGIPTIHSPRELETMVDVCLGVPTERAAGFLADAALQDPDRFKAYPSLCEHVARFGADSARVRLFEVFFDSRILTTERKLSLLPNVLRGYQQRGMAPESKWTESASLLGGAALKVDDAKTRSAALDLIGSMKLVKLFHAVVDFIEDEETPPAEYAAAVLTLSKLEAAKSVPYLATAVNDVSLPFALREKAAVALGQLNSVESLQSLADALKTAPSRLDAAIALALAGTPRGSELLLKLVEEGKASPRLLQDKVMQTKLAAHKDRLAKLTAGLPSPDARIAQIIAERKKSFTAAAVDPAVGKELFAKHCGVCHQIGGVGAKYAPQLDGVGNRGLDRLLEDILDPNRNVDAAFRQTTLNLTDGKTLSGLVVREEDETVVLVDQLGKEQAVPKKSIEDRKQSSLSPMPANWSEQISEGDFRQLAGYLLGQRSK